MVPASTHALITPTWPQPFVLLRRNHPVNPPQPNSETRSVRYRLVVSEEFLRSRTGFRERRVDQHECH